MEPDSRFVDSQASLPASQFITYYFAHGQDAEIVWQQFTQRTELNPLLSSHRQQLIEIMLIRNPFTSAGWYTPAYRYRDACSPEYSD